MMKGLPLISSPGSSPLWSLNEVPATIITNSPFGSFLLSVQLRRPTTLLPSLRIFLSVPLRLMHASHFRKLQRVAPVSSVSCKEIHTGQRYVLPLPAAEVSSAFPFSAEGILQKQKRSQGNPELTRAGMNAVAPGRVSTSMFLSRHRLTRRKPGSDIPGVPASETRATTVPV